MQDRSPQLSMELNRLLLLTSFLLHVEEGHASPVRLVCDSRLIHKYIGEAKDMEKTVVRIHPPPQKPQGREGRSSWRLTSASPLPAQGQCQALPALGCPAVLPLVNFSLQQWKCKSSESKRREILCDLALLVGAAAGAQGQVTQECGARQLGQLYEHANSFLLLLQTFGWEAGPWEPGCSPHSVEQTHVTSIFLTYRKLVQGKLSFFFHNLAKDSCKPGQGGGREPHCGAR
ncbi:thrombopoietin isoform X3 [Rissa tridactyla]|uniref:thrombopoietin isoform X3 n=1 Tax=Rissa tridactyla TaxID=75485 RepID=UPI0023BA7E70|nr:thrombopoietin isoform X3 [Rissa tridactyla]